ncbi:MAG: hypothetical protein ACK5OC_17785 [Pirellula sp.]
MVRSKIVNVMAHCGKGSWKGFTLGQYLLLVDYTSRVVRKGKAVVSSELAGIFERLQSSAEIWSQRINRLHGKTWGGRFLSASCDRLRELASNWVFGILRTSADGSMG